MIGGARAGPKQEERDARAVVSTSDAQLVAAAKQDRQAFAPLYSRYVTLIYRYCFRHLGTKEAAEDATSQIFMRAFTALPRCRVDESFRAWLFTIAHNVVVDVYRRERPEQPIEAAGDPPDAALTPEEHAVLSDEQQSIHSLLAILPESQREVVALRLSGLTHLEIAETLGRSRTSVRTLQCRALARLRSALMPQEPPQEDHDAHE